MPLNAATKAARLSVAPMMGDGDLLIKTVAYKVSCATQVQLLIV
ncbi:hypothetical protein [Nioella sp. MMSF_3534]|nr:hypothetical protein [Nioella sp. MMSF_3534]